MINYFSYYERLYFFIVILPPSNFFKMGKLAILNQPKIFEDTRETLEVVKDTHTDELIISLCGFIGTNIDNVAKTLKEIIEKDYEYHCEIKKLSDFIKSYSIKGNVVKNISRYERYQKLIDGGNELRKQYGASVLTELVIQDIHFVRQEERGEKTAFKSRKKCYIINSIKNQEELELLRLVYRDVHYLIGVFSSVEIREQNLQEEGVQDTELKLLINRDSGEDIPFGQTVRETFTQADFFLRIDSPSKEYLKTKIQRFLHLIFGSKVITPTIDETAMYLAASAAGNSACLSRQVGAALTDEKGEVISVGWNDVPKFGGDLYRSSIGEPTHQNDHRCFNLEKGCWNDKEKNIISNELVNELVKILSDLKVKVSSIPKQKLFEKIRNSRIKSIVEFSRAIHAEMHAIILGSQIAGNKVRNGKLYITTYPCHICARHIIVAGIKEVYYIEPYRKSLTTKLHYDAITEKESEKKL